MRTSTHPRVEASQTRTLLAFGWAAFVVVGLLLMDVLNEVSYGVVVPTLGIVAVLACLSNNSLRSAVRWTGWTVDRRDLAAIALTYTAVVGLLTLAFRVFTPERTLWMFLCFAAAGLVGVGGPVIYTVWVRHRSLATLGITLTGWRAVLAPALVFAGVQFSITLWGYDLPRPVDWVPLLVMALVVGVFESIFFRGFIQGRFEASFGVAPAVIGAAVLYSLYHVAYGMGPEEMAFLLGLGIVYAIAFRVGNNVLVLWPLLTPLGSFFAQLESGELVGALPWAAILGFADEFAVMATIIWLARRHERRQVDAAIVGRTQGRAETVLEPAQMLATRHSSNPPPERGGGKVTVRIEGQIDIGRPVEEVFDFAADERNEPRYNPRMHQVEKVTEGPIGIGTRYRAATANMGRTVPMMIEVTDYDPPWRLASKTHMSSMDLKGTLTFDPAPEGTRMRWSWDLEPRGILKLMSPLVALLGRRQERTIWTGLKRILEAGVPT